MVKRMVKKAVRKPVKKATKKKLPRVVTPMPQLKTGSNKAVDKTKKALHSGVRISKSGRKYTERRENRSDKRKYL